MVVSALHQHNFASIAEYYWLDHVQAATMTELTDVLMTADLDLIEPL